MSAVWDEIIVHTPVVTLMAHTNVAVPLVRNWQLTTILAWMLMSVRTAQLSVQTGAGTHLVLTCASALLDFILMLTMPLA
jgi:hypothetical protein